MIDEKPFLIAGNNHVRNPNVPGGLSQIDNKTLQWFGATVSASLRDGGPILDYGPDMNLVVSAKISTLGRGSVPPFPPERGFYDVFPPLSLCMLHLTGSILHASADAHHARLRCASRDD
ncbi:hypothetical protein K0M31_010679 [Melipona bicolor]|uniref:Uncharacterized protein n=1 Tax=Melipona bicolor TaxID=60889 RepID=A0AA40FKW5_9HYME|nr:hypothetical protein K0M31_010679 [Melipona bicolor]